MVRINLEQDIRPLSQFRADAAGLLRRVRETRRALVLTRRGRSAAVVLDVAEYERLLGELELLRDVQTAVRQLEAGQSVSHEEARKRVLTKLHG